MAKERIGSDLVLISICIPCHNRLGDLKQTLPHLLQAIEYSPPGEVVILDYNSPDGLRDYILELDSKNIIYRRYSGRNHYHMAHARNLSVLAANGEVIVISSTDIYITSAYLAFGRDWLNKKSWVYDGLYKGVIACYKQDFMAIGGFDERFEFYGPEDKDFANRLARFKPDYKEVPPGAVSVIPTPDEIKVQNYRLPLSKKEMHLVGRSILRENDDRKLIIANPHGWGRW